MKRFAEESKSEHSSKQPRNQVAETSTSKSNEPGSSTSEPGRSTSEPGPSTSEPGPSTSEPGPSTSENTPSTLISSSAKENIPGPLIIESAPGPSTSTNTNTPGPSTSGKTVEVAQLPENKPGAIPVVDIQAIRARTSSFSEASSSSSSSSSTTISSTSTSEESSDDDDNDDNNPENANLQGLFNRDYNEDENDPEWDGSSVEEDDLISSESGDAANTTDEEQVAPLVLASFDTRGNSWEGPLRYKPQLNWLRLRKSLLRNLRPLELLCLQCVCDNIKFFTDREEPFAGLPGSILQMLTKFLEKENVLFNPQILPHIITPRTEYLPINLQKPARYPGDISTVFWTEDFTHLFKRMQMCKSSVQVLELHLNHPDFLAVADDKFPSLERLNVTFSTMHNLQELHLNIVDTSDESVAIIAVSCPQLRKLNLDGNLKISDKGIKALGSEKTSVCKNSIEYLSLNDTRVSTSGLMLALSTLPNLEYLYRDNHMSLALRRYYAAHGSSKPLKLATFKITPKFKKDLVHYCVLLQNIKELDISLTPTFIAFSAFPNLQSLKYADHSLGSHVNNNRFSYVTSIMFYNNKITELDLQITHEVIDLSVIGNVCINLEVFKFQCHSAHHRIKRQAHHIMDEKRHFTKLRTLHLQFTNRQNANIPFDVYKVLLSSKYLQTITFVNCRIPDAVFRPLTTEAMESNTDIFSSLETISFRSSEFLFRRIKSLVCVAPNLKKVAIIRCIDPLDVWVDMKDSIGWFITQNRLKIEFVFVPA